MRSKLGIGNRSFERISNIDIKCNATIRDDYDSCVHHSVMENNSIIREKSFFFV